MEILPQEILCAVAEQLPVADVRHFRLVCRRWAYAGFPALVRSVSFLNTLETAEALQKLRQSPYPPSFGASRHLTIYHGTWPVMASREEWASHVQSLRGYHQQSTEASIQLAYHRYQQFIRLETSRTLGTDIAIFRSLLAHFPALQEVTLSHVHAWRMKYFDHVQYLNLSGKIWVRPYFNSFVEKAMISLLLALELYPGIRRLNVDGLLDPRELPRGHNFGIRHLYLNSLLVGDGLDDSIAEFLGSFPRLTNLVIRASPLGPVYDQRLPLHRLHWPDLRFCDITDTLVPEDDLFSFTKRHSLKHLTLKHITLTSGSWKSFFSRARELPSRPTIDYHGTLTTKDLSASIPEGMESQRLLACFLTHRDFPWPFTDPDSDIPIFTLSP